MSKGLFDRAVEALGHEGITDVICLMGFYSSVSMTLAFYDVPQAPKAWHAEDIGPKLVGKETRNARNADLRPLCRDPL